MKEVVVAKVDEIPPGQRRIVAPFQGKAGIGIFNVNGTFYALRNLCPHKFGPLCSGYVSGRVVAECAPTTDHETRTYVREGEIIRCPWHLWEFEIATGQCLVDARVRVKTYPVTIQNDCIVIHFEDR